MTAAMKVERDQRIVVDRARGLTWQTIAATHGLSCRHSRQVYLDQRRDGLVSEGFDAVDAVVEFVDRLETLVEEFALLAETAGQDSVRLGALNAKQRAIVELFNLKQAVGLVPRNLIVIRQELDVKGIMYDVVAKLENRQAREASDPPRGHRRHHRGSEDPQSATRLNSGRSTCFSGWRMIASRRGGRRRDAALVVPAITGARQPGLDNPAGLRAKRELLPPRPRGISERC